MAGGRLTIDRSSRHSDYHTLRDDSRMWIKEVTADMRPKNVFYSQPEHHDLGVFVFFFFLADPTARQLQTNAKEA